MGPRYALVLCSARTCYFWENPWKILVWGKIREGVAEGGSVNLNVS